MNAAVTVYKRGRPSGYGYYPNLYELMQERAMNVENIANILGINVSAARNLLNGRAILYYDTAVKLADYFSMELFELFTNDITFDRYDFNYSIQRHRKTKYDYYPSLFAAMRRRGMCAEDIALILHIGTPSARDMLSGRRKLLLTEALKLSDYFSMNARFLFDLDGGEYDENETV